MAELGSEPELSVPEPVLSAAASPASTEQRRHRTFAAFPLALRTRRRGAAPVTPMGKLGAGGSPAGDGEARGVGSRGPPRCLSASGRSARGQVHGDRARVADTPPPPPPQTREAAEGRSSPPAGRSRGDPSPGPAHSRLCVSRRPLDPAPTPLHTAVSPGVDHSIGWASPMSGFVGTWPTEVRGWKAEGEVSSSPAPSVRHLG